MERLSEIRTARREHATYAIEQIEQRLAQIPAELDGAYKSEAEHRASVDEADNAIKALEITIRYYTSPYPFEDEVNSAKAHYEHAYRVMEAARDTARSLTEEQVRLAEELGVLKRFTHE